MSNYRDGVSESQFNQVLNIELLQIIEVFFVSNSIGVLYRWCCNGCFYPIMLYYVLVHINMVLLPLQACKFLDEKWNPKFTLIIAQKNHHTKFFIPGKPDNVPPGNLHHLPFCCCNCVGSFIGDLIIFSNHLNCFICRDCCGQQSLPSKEL